MLECRWRFGRCVGLRAALPEARPRHFLLKVLSKGLYKRRCRDSDETGKGRPMRLETDPKLDYCDVLLRSTSLRPRRARSWTPHNVARILCAAYWNRSTFRVLECRWRFGRCVGLRAALPEAHPRHFLLKVLSKGLYKRRCRDSDETGKGRPMRLETDPKLDYCDVLLRSTSLRPRRARSWTPHNVARILCAAPGTGARFACLNVGGGSAGVLVCVRRFPRRTHDIFC